MGKDFLEFEFWMMVGFYSVGKKAIG